MTPLIEHPSDAHNGMVTLTEPLALAPFETLRVPARPLQHGARTRDRATTDFGDIVRGRVTLFAALRRGLCTAVRRSFRRLTLPSTGGSSCPLTRVAHCSERTFLPVPARYFSAGRDNRPHS